MRTVQGSSGLPTIGAIREAARSDAAEILANVWPEGRLPVDPVIVARRLGLSVFSAQLGDDVWGMLVGSGSGCDIYLDRDQPHNRYRFSCAHEIGHFVDRGGKDLPPGQAFVDKRSDAGAGRSDEVYANEFAASLLMPEPEFRRWARAENELALAQRFEVSLDTARYRYRLLGIGAVRA